VSEPLLQALLERDRRCRTPDAGTPEPDEKAPVAGVEIHHLDTAAMRGDVGAEFVDRALDAIVGNQPGTHYLGSAHTLANFESAFYRSEVADNNSYEQWQEDGSLDAAQRANAIWKRMLAEYEAPPIDPAIDEALLDFIARRKAAMPDSEV